MEIMLSRFVDFSLKTGTDQAELVREARSQDGVDYEIKADFWPLRRA